MPDFIERARRYRRRRRACRASLPHTWRVTSQEHFRIGSQSRLTSSAWPTGSRFLIASPTPHDIEQFQLSLVSAKRKRHSVRTDELTALAQGMRLSATPQNDEYKSASSRARMPYSPGFRFNAA